MLGGPLHEFLDVECAQFVKEQKEADHEGGVADTGHDECFSAGQAILRITIPEPDKQITAQADAFPSQIEQEQVIREKQRQHRRNEQIHVGKEASISFVLNHESRRIEVNKEADKGDYHNHDQGKRIKIERDFRTQTADIEPCPQHLRVRVGGRRSKQVGNRHKERDN